MRWLRKSAALGVRASDPQRCRWRQAPSLVPRAPVPRLLSFPRLATGCRAGFPQARSGRAQLLAIRAAAASCSGGPTIACGRGLVGRPADPRLVGRSQATVGCVRSYLATLAGSGHPSCCGGHACIQPSHTRHPRALGAGGATCHILPLHWCTWAGQCVSCASPMATCLPLCRRLCWSVTVASGWHRRSIATPIASARSRRLCPQLRVRA